MNLKKKCRFSPLNFVSWTQRVRNQVNEEPVFSPTTTLSLEPLLVEAKGILILCNRKGFKANALKLENPETSGRCGGRGGGVGGKGRSGRGCQEGGQKGGKARGVAGFPI